MLVILLCISLIGCDRKYEARELRGVFVRIAHMADKRFDWEGGSTYIRYAELCNKTTSECFYAKGKYNGPRWTRNLAFGATYSGNKQYVAIFSNHRHKAAFNGDELSIFNVNSGVEILCNDCNDRIKFSPENSVYGWFYNDDLILESEKSDDTKTTYIFRKALISSSSFRIEPLTSFSDLNAVRVSVTKINEYGDLEARKCLETCWLWTKNIKTGKEKEYPNQCTQVFSLEWKDGVPIMHC